SLKATLIRVIPAAALAALVSYGLMQLPLPGLPLAILSVAIGCTLVLPFIWQEVKVLVKL
ncbi:MAG: hypothetical protein GYA34_07250, partial [Chloroflexi bacterium]|nr:hypothetical protein [Chloroflexota bacterium]